MALEKDVITTKLAEEGISEKLGTGLNFETEGELNSWVEDFKTAIPAPSKKLEEYTREELEEIAKDQEFKGAKGLQSYIDSVRAKAKTPVKEPVKDPKPDDATALALKAIQDELKEMKGQKAVESFDKLVLKTCKAENLDSDDVDWVKSKLKSDASEEDVKTAIKDYKSFLAKKGIKEFSTPGGGSKNNASNAEKLAKQWRDKNTKKTK